MPKSPHRIRRQRWQVRCDSAATAFRVRQRLHDDWHDFLLPAFEKTFDHEFGGEEVTHLRTISLRLKFASEETMFESLPESLHQQLTRQVRDILLQQPHLQGKLVVFRKSTPQKDRLEALLQYLRTGSVPWEAAGKWTGRLAEELKETCREHWLEVETVLRAEQVSAAFYFRLLQLLPLTEAGQLARALVETVSHSWSAPLLEILPRLLEPEQKYFSRYTQLQLAALILSETLSARLSYTVPDFIRSTGRGLPFASGAVVDFIASFPSLRDVHSIKDSTSKAGAAKESGLGTEVLSRTSSSEPSASDEKESCALTDATVPDPLSGARHVRPFEDEGVAHARATVPDPLSGARHVRPFEDEGVAHTRATADSTTRLIPTIPDVFQEKASAHSFPLTQPSLFKSAAEADFPLLATHAGLILLHPFLPRFFESTGVKEKTNIELSPFVLPRSSALLHFLATGQDAVYEYDVAFIKVLLGLNPETSLCVSEGLINDAHKLEAESLLGAAISHWPALKNTSIAGFRSSFLQRRALLREEDGGWRLQVERQPFDMLLEYLPWSISVVKLPWMRRPLYTEW